MNTIRPVQGSLAADQPRRCVSANEQRHPSATLFSNLAARLLPCDACLTRGLSAPYCAGAVCDFQAGVGGTSHTLYSAIVTDTLFMPVIGGERECRDIMGENAMPNDNTPHDVDPNKLLSGGRGLGPFGSTLVDKLPQWFAVLVGLVYGTGFLIAFCFANYIGIRGAVVEGLKAKYVHVGLLCLQGPLSVGIVLLLSAA